MIWTGRGLVSRMVTLLSLGCIQERGGLWVGWTESTRFPPTDKYSTLVPYESVYTHNVQYNSHYHIGDLNLNFP